MESNINTIADTDIISSKLRNLLPNLTVNASELDVKNLIKNSNADDFFVSTIGVNPDGCHVFVSKSSNKEFNHSLGFVGIANMMGKKIVLVDDDTNVYESILHNDGAELASKCLDIGVCLANMGISLMQVINEIAILYLPNELTSNQKDVLSFWIEQYNNLKPTNFFIKCDGIDYCGHDYCGFTASDAIDFISEKTKSKTRTLSSKC